MKLINTKRTNTPVHSWLMSKLNPLTEIMLPVTEAALPASFAIQVAVMATPTSAKCKWFCSDVTTLRTLKPRRNKKNSAVKRRRGDFIELQDPMWKVQRPTSKVQR